MATVPFIRSMSPGARSRAASAPVKVNVSRLPPGEQATAEWRSMPVWVLHRSAEMLAGLEKTFLLQQLRNMSISRPHEYFDQTELGTQFVP
jgi:ubiquinol-cytochrome c reductase iron-sulfur subunit